MIGLKILIFKTPYSFLHCPNQTKPKINNVEINITRIIVEKVKHF